MMSTNPRALRFAPRLSFLPLATGVLLVAAVLRLIFLHDIPPGLSQDEVLNADIVTFIRQGQHALFFHEGYGHEPLYHYWSVPFQPLFGDNVFSIRLPAVYLGMLLVAATMRWVRRDFGPGTALLTGAGLAISWWPIIFSRVGLRPILDPLLLVLVAWFWPRRPWLAGLFLGLTVYTYTAARTNFLIPLLFLAYLIASNRWRANVSSDGRQVTRRYRALPVLLVSLLLAVPLALTLRADPSLDQRFTQLSGPLDALLAGDVGPVLDSTLATLGVFSFSGDPRWTYTLPARPLFDAFTAVFFYAGIALSCYHWRQPRYALVLIWLAVTLLPGALAPQAPSIIRLIGAVPVVYLLPALAITGAWQRLAAAPQGTHKLARRRFAFLLLAIALLGINLGRTVLDGFIVWPAAVETRLHHYQTVLLDIGRHWNRTSGKAAAGKLVVADTFFEPIDANSLRRNLGYDPGARWVQMAPGGGAIVFPAGIVGGENGRFYVPEFAPPPDQLLAAAGIDPQPLARSEGVPSFAVYPLPAAPHVPAVDTVLFNDAITLLGYEILPRQGQALHLFTYWRVEAPLPWDLTGFAHLVSDESGEFTQYDGLDAAAVTLRPGDTFIQRHTVPLPPQPTGTYTLKLGLYTSSNGRRLLLTGETADHVVLASGLVFDGTNGGG